jgi:hypothetical protein
MAELELRGIMSARREEEFEEKNEKRPQLNNPTCGLQY